jgi:hypothetical protein
MVNELLIMVCQILWVLCFEIYGTLIQGPASPSNTHPGGARDRCLAARGTRDAAGLRP